MSEKTILTQFSMAELAQEVVKLLAPHLSKPDSRSVSEGDTRLLTRKEVAHILKISLPTLDQWTRQGSIKAYRIRNRVLYKEGDVQSALTVMKVRN